MGKNRICRKKNMLKGKKGRPRGFTATFNETRKNHGRQLLENNGTKS